MADISEPRSAFLPRLDGARALGAIVGLFGSIAAAREAARTFAELDTLTDAELAARGIARRDIAGIAARAIKRF